MRLARSTSNSSMNCSLSSRNLAPACLRYLRRTQRGATAAGLWPRVLRCLRCGSQGMGRWAAGRRAGALLQDGCQAPALQLAHAADHSARPVAAQVAHDNQRVAAGVEQLVQTIDYHFLGHGLPRAPLAHVLAQVDELDLPIIEPLEKVGRWLVGRQVDDLAQVQLLEEREVELVGLAGAVQVCLDHPEVRGRDEAHVSVLCALCSGCRSRLGRGESEGATRATAARKFGGVLLADILPTLELLAQLLYSRGIVVNNNN